MAKNRVKLNILDTEYVVLSDESEEYVLDTAKEIEKKILALMNANPKVSVIMAVTLVAMDYCDEYKKCSESADNLRSQIKDYLEDSSKSRMEAAEYKKEIERLKREVQTLRLRLGENGKAVKNENTKSNKDSKNPSPISKTAKRKNDTDIKEAKETKQDDSYITQKQEIIDFFDNNN